MKHTKSKYIRVSTLIFAIFMLIPMISLISCANNDTPTVDTTVPQVTDNGEASTTTPETEAPDPFEGVNFENKECSILYWEDVENPEYFVEKITGNNVNDAIFKRNANTEKRLGVKLVYTPTPGDSGNSNAFLTFVQNANNSGTTKYDIASAHSRSIGLIATNGLTVDLLQYDNYLDFTMPYWQTSLLNEATINGKLHFVSGDISTNMLYMMYCQFYNIDMMERYNIQDPYDLVVEGKWTIDKMIELSNGVYEDTNGSGSPDIGDTFAQYAYVLHTDAFLWGSGIIGIDKDENGNLVLGAEFQGEKTQKLVEKLGNYFCVGNTAIIDKSTYKTNFVEGRSLFITDRADIAIFDIKTDAFEIGILPVPKYDEEQKDYKTLLGNPFSLYSITSFAAEPEMASAVLECLAMESYNIVTPEIFEVTMKVKYSSGSKYTAIYDTIRNGAVYDLARIFFKVLTTPIDSIYQDTIKANTSDWMSKVKSVTRIYERELPNIQKKFE